MDVRGWRIPLFGLFLAVTAPAWSGTGALQGQEIPQVGEEKLLAFARAFAEVSETRDDFYDRFGRTHDDQGRAELRAAMDASIAEILQQHGLTHDEYRRLNVVVSTDPAQRAVFERMLEEVRASASS